MKSQTQPLLMNRRQFLVSSSTLLIGACAHPVTSLTPVIRTESGPVQGEVVDGVYRFLGIPYAEPPFGEKRWRSPVPRRKWQSVFPAIQYGSICPQTGGIQIGLPDEGEDCLNLNIWSPDPGAVNLPVMVWAHGGGQISGSGANELYDGTRFAQEGVVLVTCNRRLGAEGYLYLEELFGDDIGPGNLGIQDLILVLLWVQENITRFGGNPSNVTLFGESGGGAATQAVIATPGSKGLVHRVIPQSGGHSAQRTEKATEVARRIINQLNIRPGDIDALRRVQWQTFVDVYETLDEEHLGSPQIYLPVINRHMPVHPVDAAHHGIGLEIDYLIGTCRDEANFFSAIMPSMVDSIFHRRALQIIESIGLSWEEILVSYARTLPHLDHNDIFNRVVGDMWFRIPAMRIVEGRLQHPGSKTFVYQFDWESPLIGAAHALDIMVFGNGLPFGFLSAFADYQKTADFMRKAWVAFAATGNPSIPGFSWPSYLQDQAVVRIDEPISIHRGQPPELEPLAEVITRKWIDLNL